jgi:hypothetical protein
MDFIVFNYTSTYKIFHTEFVSTEYFMFLAPSFSYLLSLDGKVKKCSRRVTI